MQKNLKWNGIKSVRTVINEAILPLTHCEQYSSGETDTSNQIRKIDVWI